MRELVSFLSSTSDLGIFAMIVGVLVVLYILPNTVRRMGVVRLGPVEMEHVHQSLNHDVSCIIDRIDTARNEELWDMTEYLLDVTEHNSKVQCEAVAGYLLSGVADEIRTIILINHLASKLQVADDTFLRDRIMRGVSRAMRASGGIRVGSGCPVEGDVRSCEFDHYIGLVDDWISRARLIVTKSCRDKIKTYETALENTKDSHWVKVYKECIRKNEGYIRGMGHEV